MHLDGFVGVVGVKVGLRIHEAFGFLRDLGLDGRRGKVGCCLDDVDHGRRCGWLLEKRNKWWDCCFKDSRFASDEPGQQECVLAPVAKEGPPL